MGYFDHVMMSGLPPMAIDLHLGGALSALAMLLASLLAILCGRESDLTRRIISRWRSASRPAPNLKRPSSKRRETITVSRAIRLTMGPRK